MFNFKGKVTNPKCLSISRVEKDFVSKVACLPRVTCCVKSLFLMRFQSLVPFFAFIVQILIVFARISMDKIILQRPMYNPKLFNIFYEDYKCFGKTTLILNYFISHRKYHINMQTRKRGRPEKVSIRGLLG